MIGKVSDRAMLELIELVYAASCKPAAWADVALNCQRLFPGSAFSLVTTLNGAGYDPLPVSAGWDPAFVEQYKQHYHAINPYNELLRPIPAGRVVRASELVPPRWLDRQPFFHEWLKPAGNFTHGAGVTLAREEGSFSRLSYDLPKSLAELEGTAAEVLRLLGPHCRRALEVTYRLGGAAAKDTALEALVERMADAAIVIDGSRRVAHANREARDLLRRQLMICERAHRGLVFAAPTAEESFARALKACLSPSAQPSASSFRVQSSDSSLRPVHVLPLYLSGSAARSAVGSALVLVIIGSSAGQPLPPAMALQAIYGLSRREAEVVLRIAGGASVPEVADDLAVSLSTARNQLAAAMAKMGVHRRADLVAQLGGLIPRLKVGIIDK